MLRAKKSIDGQGRGGFFSERVTIFMEVQGKRGKISRPPPLLSPEHMYGLACSQLLFTVTIPNKFLLFQLPLQQLYSREEIPQGRNKNRNNGGMCYHGRKREKNEQKNPKIDNLLLIKYPANCDLLMMVIYIP